MVNGPPNGPLTQLVPGRSAVPVRTRPTSIPDRVKPALRQRAVGSGSVSTRATPWSMS
jgi:hypothetical protein